MIPRSNGRPQIELGWLRKKLEGKKSRVEMERDDDEKAKFTINPSKQS
jgi:hypothetical protein